MPAMENTTPSVQDAALEEDFHGKKMEMRNAAKDSVVVVDNLPEVGSDKYGKLCEKVFPIFENAGTVARDENGKARIQMVKTPDDVTRGYAFVEYVSPEEAFKAVRHLHNYSLSKKHVFWVDTAGALERLQGVPEEFQPPPEISQPSEGHVDYKSWLLDERGRDMFMIRADTETSVYWNDHVVKPTLDYARDAWTDQHANWSPKGTYLFTVHQQGIQIWGRRTNGERGETNFEKVMRFEHRNVTQAAFSPCENYLVTFDATDPERDDKRNPRALIIWDVLTGRKKRGFLGPSRRMLGPEGQIPWPIFHWSHDDKFFARIAELPNPNGDPTLGLSVFETPSMGMLGKKSFRAPSGHILDFAWSPTQNILAYSTPEEFDSPARVSVFEIPSRKELRQKALFSVSGIKLVWHPDGTFLCCQVERMTKSKKGRFVNFELFRVKAKDMPIEVLEYKEKETITEFKWEPNGYKFGVIHGHLEHPGRTDCTFYDMQGVSGELKKMFTLEKKVCNQIHWSPKGRFALLATLGSQSGNMEFYDVSDSEKKGEPNKVGSDEHFLCSEVQWDPSGRFVATAVTYWRNREENGYIIWSLYGKQLVSTNVDKLYQFAWRPRPASLLNPAEEKKARKDLKTLREKYEREDKEMRANVSSGNAARRKELRDAYKEFRAKADERLAAETERRQELIAAVATAKEDAYETIVEVVEEIISVKTTVDFDKKLLNSDDERD